EAASWGFSASCWIEWLNATGPEGKGAIAKFWRGIARPGSAFWNYGEFGDDWRVAGHTTSSARVTRRQSRRDRSQCLHGARTGATATGRANSKNTVEYRQVPSAPLLTRG